jgi:SET domain-containing protein
VDVVEPWSDVWADPRLAVRASAIEGRGLFAVDDVPVGTLLLRLGGRLVSSSELMDLLGASQAGPRPTFVDTITVYPETHLVLPANTIAHFANHSCDPNAWHVGPYEIAARGDLPAGTEVTIDYATHSGAAGFRMDCNCESANCRRQVTSDDWRQPDLRARYAGHWTPALQVRIDTTAGPATHSWP